MWIYINRNYPFWTIEKKIEKKIEQSLGDYYLGIIWNYLGDKSKSLSHDVSVLQRMWHRKMKKQWLNTLQILKKM